MSTRFKGFALLAILLCAIGVIPVFASPYALQNPAGMVNSTNATSGNVNPSPSMYNPSNGQITVTTDKTTYNDGDKVTISGSTQEYISDTPITVKIISPIGNIVKVDQVDLGSDKTFSTSITATGSLWQAAGAYQVMVQFGSKDRTAETTFQFTGSASGGQAGNTIKVDGTDLSVKYSITNGKVLGIKADTQSKSLIVSIQTAGDGVLTVTLPRGLIDAKVGVQDSHFYVISDGQEADFQEMSQTTTDRTLSIPFTDGTEEIEIIGTQIIPEFGPIAALVLAIAIVSIIAVSAKTGLRFMPKY
jgi:predicted secreted protein with PEFG-CTERM motif